HLATEASESGHEDSGEVGVAQGPGPAMDLTRGAVAPLVAEEVRHPELSREERGRDALVADGGQDGAQLAGAAGNDALDVSAELAAGGEGGGREPPTPRACRPR